ncbi:hypothetical protein HN843_00900, partial [bacterium]|nr:hypothetical protein [bacterium]
DQIFGVHLPDNVGLTGNGLTGEMEFSGDHYVAEGIPVTPFTDAQPNVETPYQLALVVAKDATGAELASSRPVIPVSTEVNCVSSGCHSSELDIIYEHEDEDGYDPNNRPIFCAGCHGSPALGTQSVGDADYFSLRIHDKHDWISDEYPGAEGCNKCHPGPEVQCLRGTMSNDFGMTCIDCHGNMTQVFESIEQGRVPWMDEPQCRDCHTSQYGEPQGQLYRMSTGHGGLYCAACHGSPHAIFPSRESNDNVNNVDLQGHAGTLTDCTVCHGVTPNGPGPHGYEPTTDVIEMEILEGTGKLRIYPSPLQMGSSTTIEARSSMPSSGKLLVFDARGRTIRLLHAQDSGDGTARAVWNGRNANGAPVSKGIYFLRWDDGENQASGKLLIVE